MGVNSAVDNTNDYNYISFLPVNGAISAAQTAMNTTGYTLRLAGNPVNTWVGQNSTNITNGRSWQSRFVSRTDNYVLFEANTASSRSVIMNAAENLRGLYFTGALNSNDPFSFSGSSTLTIGRGGLTNYDDSAQQFTAPITLGASQFWHTGPGGVAVASLNTAGHLLELGGSGSSQITGAITGSGSIALSAGSLELSSASSYTA